MEFVPDLAEKIGLNEAIVLQQIHCWIKKNEQAGNSFYEGKYWVCNSYEEWQKQFPWWSIPTIRRTLTALQNGYEKKDKKGSYVIPPLLFTGNFNKLKIDNTKWYSVNYENLKKICICLF